MIAIRKEDKKLYAVVSSNENFIEIVHANCAINFHKKELYTLYFNESEVQQRIEAAVKEHITTAQETGDHNEYLQDKLKRMEAYNEEWQEVNEKLKARIAELEAAQQPVEVSAELAEAIEFYKNEDYPSTEWWQGHFLNKTWDGYISSRTRFVEHQLSITTIEDRIRIISNGYTVKPDPLRTRIAAILGSDHEHLDAVVAAAREGEAE